MGKYERLSRKIDENEQAMNDLQNLNASDAKNVRFSSAMAESMYNARKMNKKMNKLTTKNEKLQAKKNNIDAKLDEETSAVNNSLENIFHDNTMKLPNKDSEDFAQEAQNLINVMKQKIHEAPEQYKDFINDMKRCPSKAEVAVSSMPIALAKAIAFRKKHPDIANLVDAGFRIHGVALDRKNFDAETWTITGSVDVNNVEITFDPSGKVGRNIDNHQANDIQMVETGEIDYDAAKQAYHDAREEQRQAKKFERRQKRNNTEEDTDAENES